MEQKKILKGQGELAYLYAVVLLALGTVLCVKANLGMSMIAVPAYCLSALFGGMMGFAEYIFQGALLILMCLCARQFKWQYLTSFVTALLYGGILNLFQLALSSFNPDHPAICIPLFIGGTLLVGLSVALFFNTYLAPTVYDMFVKVLCVRYKLSVKVTKTVFDCCMLLLSVVLAIFVYGVFGNGDLGSFWGFVGVIRSGGVYIGTVLTVCFNGLIISSFDKLLKKYISFDAKIPKMYALLNYARVDEETEREAQ